MLELDFSLNRGAFRLDVSLFSRCQVTGLIGASGSGKTSLLMALMGILRPRNGRIAINGGDELYNSGKGVNVPIEHRRLGFVFQNDLLFPHLSVRRNLLFGYERTDPVRRRLKPADIYSLLDLESLLERGVELLSGGEKRRVALGRALLTSPQMLLLDEPLTGLDTRLRDRILAYLLRLKSELAIPMVYVSHSYSDISAICDTVALIEAEPEGGSCKHSTVSTLGHPHEVIQEAARVADSDAVESLIEGIIEEVDPAGGFSRVRADNLTLIVAAGNHRAGQHCYVTMRADDIILAVGELPLLSSRNVWHGTVVSFQDYQGMALVTVDIGRLVRVLITEKSCNTLELEPGATVHVIAKAASMRTVVLGNENSG